ncbi:chromosomal replication initiator protein DnaA [Candidatus Parcubacteria bacterium]|uniref:Chromosomal replication initiator protein DnaA n=1 Tax=Candidatus Kaiserbacteria bacterium CG10_big_fil_rev_8_21_14_0_10_47_16 TaxID=1974608 RepID=A0A2H0UDW4_9BACT|nr:chromosomal replication initiator protein DnaA [Candidatus Parcubacteria bacterium]PIR84618.1 MAG: chromosomal replication initiator protein DnaA [Candidatus Kaiserbacteria bacterium CG10_big_fil_rev_8_21_14_0_10_47_16]
MDSLTQSSRSIVQTQQIDVKQLWDDTLVQIELSITAANFKTWFRDTHIVSLEDGTVTLGVPSVFVRDWLADKFQSLILKTLRDLTPHVRSIEYAVVQRSSKKFESSKKQTVNATLPLEEYYINKNDNLNPKYLFETFVVGPFNELAHAAAKAVCEKPGIVYNPLFIYGKTGHGKTHLIQAVGNQLKRNGRSVFYVTSERFAVDYMNSLQSGTANNFKNKYRQYDVLIMDDVQFLSSKEKTQEELFHLFNAMHDNNKQIVFSSDTHPALLSGLQERLQSRFAQGMIVDIPQPDSESRASIIQSKTARSNITLENDVITFLATTIEGNIRELEGALNIVMCQTQVTGRTLSLDEVVALMKNSARPRRSLAVSDVVDKVARYFDVEPSSIYEKTRRKEIVKPRQLIMYILREDFAVSYPSIGQKLGGRDHTTVIHSCEKIKREVLEGNDDLVEEIAQIRALLQ